MAITQISQIQIRKGKKENLPQLSGGELGWALDTRELFVGNGEYSEGAAVLGNTRVLTELDLTASKQIGTYTGTLADNTTTTVVTMIPAGLTSSVTASWPLVTTHTGKLEVSCVRNGAYQMNIITFAYDGSAIQTNVVQVGANLGITLSMTVTDSNVNLTYATSSTGKSATFILKMTKFQ